MEWCICVCANGMSSRCPLPRCAADTRKQAGCATIDSPRDFTTHYRVNTSTSQDSPTTEVRRRRL
jgi:hypothetical protein